MQKIGNYELGEKIGDGAYGVVYKARDSMLDRDVAIKMFGGELTPENKNSLVSSLRILCNLQHPNIVPVFQFGTENDVPYLVMQYVEGDTLDKLVARDALSPRERLSIVTDVCRALQYAHKLGVLHRDINPANIMVTRQGKAVLLGFGIAAPDSGAWKTSTGIRVSTFSYTSPEIICSVRPDPRSDIWSVGAVFYELATGSKPFDKKSAVEYAQRVLAAPPPSFSNWPSDLPPILQRTILRMLAKDPNDRFQSMGEVLQELEGATRSREDRVYPGSSGSVGSSCAGGSSRGTEDPAITRSAPPPSASESGAGWLGKILGALGGKKGAPPPPQEHRNEAPPPDDVHFSVTSRSSIAPGEKFTLNLWAHLESQRDEVIRRAREAVASKDISIQSKGAVPVARGTTLSVRLVLDDLVVSDPEDTIRWNGSIGNATFVAEVPVNAKIGPRHGLLRISAEGLEIAKVNFTVNIGSPTPQEVPLPVQEHRHSSAFASYCSQDRDAVLARIQGIQKAAPSLKIFLDVLVLRSGEDWESRLWKEIPTKDVFYLFWSQAASHSEWVEKEWRCALKTRGIGFIDPIPLDSPDVAPPPTELANKHFNDWTLAFMKSKRS